MQKVGDRLSKYDIVNEVFDAIGEIAKKSDFISAGLKGQDVYALCKQGYLERVKKGYYKLAVGDEPKEELILSKLMTYGVVCVESALFTTAIAILHHENGRLPFHALIPER